MRGLLNKRFANRWLWLCPFLSIVLAAAVLMLLFGSARKNPATEAPSAASNPDSRPRVVNSASTPVSTVRRLAPSVRSIALS